MTELTRVGLTCRAFAWAGSMGGSHDRAHTGSGSHAGHSCTRPLSSPTKRGSPPKNWLLSPQILSCLYVDKDLQQSAPLLNVPNSPPPPQKKKEKKKEVKTSRKPCRLSLSCLVHMIPDILAVHASRHISADWKWKWACHQAWVWLRFSGFDLVPRQLSLQSATFLYTWGPFQLKFSLQQINTLPI